MHNIDVILRYIRYIEIDLISTFNFYYVILS